MLKIELHNGHTIIIRKILAL